VGMMVCFMIFWGFYGIWHVWKQSGIISSASSMRDCRQHIRTFNDGKFFFALPKKIHKYTAKTLQPAQFPP